MLIPSSTFAVAAFVVMFVPGFVFAVVRIWMRGFRADDKGIDTRVAQALVVSVILDAIYMVVFFGWLTSLVAIGPKSIRVLNPVGLGLAVLAGAVLIPALLSLIIYWPWRRERVVRDDGKTEHKWIRKWAYTSVPTSWDWSASDPTNRFIRILLPDGRWVGGYYGPGSYVSTYPEPRDIYISAPCRFSRKGKFLGESDADGLWTTIPDGSIVEFINPRRG